MGARFNVILSDDLNDAIDTTARETETSKSEILRKALQLYLAAVDGRKRGLKLGLVDSADQLKTEIVGL